MGTPAGGSETLPKSPGVLRSRVLAGHAFEASRVVAQECDRTGAPPSVADVASVIGLSGNGTYKRLLNAVDAGWLVHLAGRRHGCFTPTRALMDAIGPRASVQVMEAREG